MNGQNVKWLAPSPLWTNISQRISGIENGNFSRPAILRFDSDLFMDELLAVTALYPDKLCEWIAQPENWRSPMLTPPTAARLQLSQPVSEVSRRLRAQQQSRQQAPSPCVDTQKVNQNLPFKLYQPAHQRYYLVASSLICQQPGLPDRGIDLGSQEQVSFVIRRIVNSEQPTSNALCNLDAPGCKEYAFITTSTGAFWKEIKETSQKESILPDEERMPLFPINFNEKNGRKRRILAGTIPVGKRETYLVSPEDDTPEQSAQQETLSPDPRRLLFDEQVTSLWKNMVEQTQTIVDTLKADFPNFDSDPSREGANRREIFKTSREQNQLLSWYILLDFANFLEEYLTNVWNALNDDSLRPGLNTQERNLLQALDNIFIVSNPFQIPSFKAILLSETTGYLPIDVSNKLIDALVKIKSSSEIESNLESIEEPYDRSNSKQESVAQGWPGFLFTFADPELTSPRNGAVPRLNVDENGLNDVEVVQAKIDALADVIEAALPETDKPLPDIERPSVPFDTRDPWFVIRCVYEQPNCTPFSQAVVSKPTQPFQLATFFEPDAPARQIRIQMPVDITPAGLRKFRKNATFMISDMLCGQIKRIRSLSFGDLVLSVLPWPFHKDLPDPGRTGSCKDGGGNFGMMCSLSIPIVTIVALILLLIIVALFDIFFHWLPLLFTCFPFPFKGKSNNGGNGG